MNKHADRRRFLANCALLLIAMVWGFSMVAQRMGMSYLEPFTFCTVRFSLGVAVLIPVVWLLHRREAGRSKAAGETPAPVFTKQLWTGGFLCGFTVFCAVGLQQVALVDTSAGKTGFITALYIVVVPLIGLLVHQRPPRAVWIAVVLGLVGLYLLCIKEGFSVAPSDLIILASTLFYAAQIWIIAHYSRRVDPLCFTVIQLSCVAVFSFFAMLLFEHPVWSDILACGPILAYVGFVAVGFAYSVQTVAQKYADPTVAALILSMEAAFSALGGFIMLGEILSPRESAGCALMLAAVVIAQLPERGKKTEPGGTEETMLNEEEADEKASAL